ncbi:hypothetical protein Tco_0116705 [Tanacetum coccineum]
MRFKSERASNVKTTDWASQVDVNKCYVNKNPKEVNSRAKIQSHKTRNSNKPVDQKSHTQKPGRQIFTGHRFSPNKTSAVYEKTSPRSDLRWKPSGKNFQPVGLSGFLQEKYSGALAQARKSQSMAAEKADISETIVKVDSQMMIQKNDV